MKQIKINNCLECPFLLTSYDDAGTLSSMVYSCKLSKHLGLNKNQISVVISMNGETSSDDEINPDWCPIEHGVQITLRNEMEDIINEFINSDI